MMKLKRAKKPIKPTTMAVFFFTMVFAFTYNTLIPKDQKRRYYAKVHNWTKLRKLDKLNEAFHYCSTDSHSEYTYFYSFSITTSVSDTGYKKGTTIKCRGSILLTFDTAKYEIRPGQKTCKYYHDKN